MANGICKDGSHVMNCVVIGRGRNSDGALFRVTSDFSGVKAYLNGYAIIPLEEYSKLIDKDFSGMLADAELTRKALNS